jgi:MarR family transcriptional regulator, organic hydroperoxide resistance regulator
MRLLSVNEKPLSKYDAKLRTSHDGPNQEELSVGNEEFLAAELGKFHQGLSRAITAYMQPLLSQWDLRVLDVILLRIIYKNPGITIMDLTSRTGSSQSTVSSRVKRHEQLGFLVKKTNPDDKRSCQLYVQGAIRDVLSEVVGKLDTFFVTLVSGLDIAEQRALVTVLPALQAIIASNTLLETSEAKEPSTV